MSPRSLRNALFSLALAPVAAALPASASADDGYLGGSPGGGGRQGEGYLPDVPRTELDDAVRSNPWQRTLTGPAVHVGVAGGPDFRVLFLDGDPALALGGGGTLILGHIVGIGGAGWHTLNRTRPPDEYIELGFDPDAAGVEVGWGGLTVEGWVLPEAIVHLHLSALLGGGRAALVETVTGTPLEGATVRFFASELNAAAELNVTPFLRLRVGAGYRFAAGVEAEWITNRDLFSPTVSFGLRFGVF